MTIKGAWLISGSFLFIAIFDCMKAGILLFILGISFADSYAQQTNNFKLLHMLTGGTWQMKTAKGIIGETWKKVNDTELHSTGYKINLGGDTSLLENVQLVKKGGAIYYIPILKNQNEGKPVAFKLTIAKSKQFIFINPTHDFPQRIVYQFITPDSLHAWVDGKYHGKFAKQDFYYKRVKK